jgi:UDP-glucose 4-epimerase
MRILVTGAAGTLGRALLPRLRDGGHDAIGFDVRSDQPGMVAGDVRDPRAVRAAMDGVGVVVHTAAWHGIHLANHSEREFLDLNVGGTFNVWQAAVDARVRGVVFSSTMGVYGEMRRPPADDRIAVLDEAMPLQPGDVYGWSKVVGEELCRYHLRRDGIPSIALRYGMFVPEPFMRYGIRLLYGGVDERDVAEAVVASISAVADGRVEHEAFNVESLVPFGPEDDADLRRDPLVPLERRLPGSAALLRSRGVAQLKPVTEIFPMTRIEDRLGFRPRHNFAEWLEELRARPDVIAEASPPWP